MAWIARERGIRESKANGGLLEGLAAGLARYYIYLYPQVVQNAIYFK